MDKLNRPSCCGKPMRKNGLSYGLQCWRCVVNTGEGHTQIDGDRQRGRQYTGEAKSGADRTRQWRQNKQPNA